jgi:hypothetical protein
MRNACRGLIFGSLVALAMASAPATAQTVVGSASLALKNGESVEVGPVYFVQNCKSILKSTPEVEILDGPAGVEATIKEAIDFAEASPLPVPDDIYTDVFLDTPAVGGK